MSSICLSKGNEMTRLYKEFISVDSDFIPVFSAFSDKEHPNKWKTFFPHENFKSILSMLVDTLEMGSNENNKSLWLYGAYGTGKTFASFVIKHLLEDDIDQINQFCDKHQLTQLNKRIEGIRSKGNILVVHRSSSAGIIGEDRLVNAIWDSVKSSLQANGYTYMGQNSQREKILEIIRSPESPFNFKIAFEQNRAKFEGYSSVSSVIEDLDNLHPDDSADLLEIIIEVASSYNFHFYSNIHHLIEWLDDVRTGNDIYATVFIWDEFTEFFKNNQSNLTGLQELAQASPSNHFYLFLITHSGSEIIHDLSARRIIEERFKKCLIEMADTTAFMLMGQALKINRELDDEWSTIIEGLWVNVEKYTKEILLEKAPDIKISELKKLLPIHPFTAYLLKVISRDISSNQRTMFQFLSGEIGYDENPKNNFRWFIGAHTTESHKWNYLTVDYLWNYFFTEENMDLDPVFKTAMSNYNNYVPVCQDNEDLQRILRVAFLLSAMQQKSGGTKAQGQSGLLRPTLKNISYAFSGTPIENKIEQSMSIFVMKTIFGKVEEGGEVLFVPPAGNIDQDRWDLLKLEVEQQISFEKIITDSSYGVYDQFKPDGYLAVRFEILPITIKSYQSAAKSIENLKQNIIPVLFIFAKDENERSKIKSTVEKILNNSLRKLIVVDFSGQMFSGADYDRFIKEKTNERYYSNNPNYVNQYNLAKANSKSIIDEWKQKLTLTTLTVFEQEIDNSFQVIGSPNLRKRLKEINYSWFGCGLEELTENDKLFSSSGYRDDFPLMAMGKKPIPSNFAYTREIVNRLTNDQIWNKPDYWIAHPNHIVSRMKREIEYVIQDSFEKYRQVAVYNIWQILEKPPFGLLSCQGSAFLLGFLLKEYADSSYYKNDGINTVPLDYTDLSSLIFAVVKELPQSKNKYIVKQTQEQIEFCRITGEIFKLPKHKLNSVDDVGKNISIFLSDHNYPLWSLNYFVKKQNYSQEDYLDIIKAIELYCEFVSTNQPTGRDRLIISNDLYVLYKNNPSLSEILANIVKVENMRLGMDFYIRSCKPEIMEVIDGLGINSQELITSLLEKLSPDSSYLWQKGDTDHQLDQVYYDYKLIDSINKILTERKQTLSDARRAVDQKTGLLKLPELIIRNESPQLAKILNVIDNVRKNEIIDKCSAIEILDNYSRDFIDFFNNQYHHFATAIQNRLNSSLDDDEITYLFDNIENNTFNLETDVFLIQINTKLNNYRKNKKINHLKQAWKARTGSTSPEEWSRIHLMPIICLFQSDNNDTLFTFRLINHHEQFSVSEELIDKAIKYVKSDKLNILTDENKCNLMFLDNFAKEYAFIIDDVQILKKFIAENVGDDADLWMSTKRKAVENIIEEFAKKQYNAVYKQKVIEKINSLSPNKAQEYLIDLIVDKPLVGISILKDQE